MPLGIAKRIPPGQSMVRGQDGYTYSLPQGVAGIEQRLHLRSAARPQGSAASEQPVVGVDLRD
jgi:hypothetical protein